MAPGSRQPHQQLREKLHVRRSKARRVGSHNQHRALGVAAHWIGLEIVVHNQRITLVLIQLANSLVRRVVRKIAQKLHRLPHELKEEVARSHNIADMCGWTIAFRWVSQLQCHEDLQQRLNQHADLAEAIRASEHAWTGSRAPQHLFFFAQHVRAHFLQSLSNPPHEVFSMCFDSIAAGFPPELRDTIPSEDEGDRDESSDHFRIRRLDDFFEEVHWLGSDEINFLLPIFRVLDPACLFVPALEWDSHLHQLRVINGSAFEPSWLRRAFLFAAVDDHWILISTFCLDWQWYFIFHSAQSDLTLFSHIASELARWWRLPPDGFQFTFQHLHQPHGFCGWAVLGTLAQRIGFHLPPPSPEVHAMLENHDLGELHMMRNQAPAALQISPLLDFAITVRTVFLAQLISPSSDMQYRSAGAVSSEAKQPSKPSHQTADPKQDPLWIKDPWQKATVKAKSAKWDELQLAKDHPFVGADGSPLLQRHRLQVTPAQGGVVLASKSHLADLLALKPQVPTAVLLPVADKAVYGELADKVQAILPDQTATSV